LVPGVGRMVSNVCAHHGTGLGTVCVVDSSSSLLVPQWFCNRRRARVLVAGRIHPNSLLSLCFNGFLTLQLSPLMHRVCAKIPVDGYRWHPTLNVLCFPMHTYLL
jgi:hypothetical protein